MTEEAKARREELAGAKKEAMLIHQQIFRANDGSLEDDRLIERQDAGREAFFHGFREGFDAGYAYQEERLKIAVNFIEAQRESEAESGGIYEDIFVKPFDDVLAKIRGEK